MAALSETCILIVEDEPIIALDLASLVRETGADVLGPAMTLREAEILSCDDRIMIALLDIRIGKGTITHVATKLADRGVALIFHTGHENAESLLRQWPESRVLAKPARADDLLRVLGDFAGRR